MTVTQPSYAERLLPRFDSSPTPYHAVQTVASELESNDFSELVETEAFPVESGRYFIRRGGSLVAWASGPSAEPSSGIRIVGAHTDSPNLRVKPKPDTSSFGWNQLGVEVYGSALLNSWLDRDLGLAGRVALHHDDGVRVALFHDTRPLMRVPQLAVHLDRDVNERGLILNRQQHMSPIWGVGDARTFTEYLADQVGGEPDDVVAWDAMAFDVTNACLGGIDRDFVVSARIDNILSCLVATDALAVAANDSGPHTAMICLFDHEEVGSVSSSGAAGPLLESTISRIVASRNGGVDERSRCLAASMMVSADGAHATHPNYADRHEADHKVRLNAGPVLKLNSNQRYATDAVTAAEFRMSCDDAGVPLQTFVSRSDLACGSTIGPLTAGRLGIPVVDTGCAQLAMHSAREMAGSADPEMFHDALVRFLQR